MPPVDRAPTADERAALDAALPDQPFHLAVVDTGHREGESPWAGAVAAVREVARLLAVPVTIGAAATAPWHPGRCAEIRVAGEVVGHAGELHPRVCRDFGVPERTGYAEVDLDAMIAQAPDVVLAPDISTMPVAKADLALIVDEDVPAASVEAAVVEGAGALLESIRLFDVYRGDPVPPGRKSLAFALRFRAADRTLTDDEVAKARDGAVAAAVAATGAEQRG